MDILNDDERNQYIADFDKLRSNHIKIVQIRY